MSRSYGQQRGFGGGSARYPSSLTRRCSDYARLQSLIASVLSTALTQHVFCVNGHQSGVVVPVKWRVN